MWDIAYGINIVYCMKNSVYGMNVVYGMHKGSGMEDDKCQNLGSKKMQERKQ